ncbi:aromatic-ring hydroxylase C-terminal domain-containing protein [Micromonospora humida]
MSPSARTVFLDQCGLHDTGGLLVRPDGHIAWHTPTRHPTASPP